MKALILAGTHERENEFSYAVINLLKERYNVTAEPEEFIGIDGARKGELWNINDNISLAKVEKIGPQSEEYLNSLTEEELKSQFIFFLRRWSTVNNQYEPAYSFKNVAHLSSVHNPLFKKSKADFYIDLHSYHKTTKDVPGTTMIIMPCAKEEHVAVLSEALVDARAFASEIYGHNNYNVLPRQMAYVNRDIDVQEYVENHVDEFILPSEQKRVLGQTAPFDEKYMEELQKTFSELELAADKALPSGDEYLKRYLIAEKPKWALFSERNWNVVTPNFVFEAISWGPEQQEAVARFVVDYLEPQLRLH
ncbi:MAG: hypothetical protein ACP5N3_04815 [Candidatus Nanoarchaeia archaeon]